MSVSELQQPASSMQEQLERELIIAARRGLAAAAARRLKLGASPNAADAATGQTALIAAIISGNLQVAGLLLEAGAHVDLRGGEGAAAPISAAPSPQRSDQSSAELAAQLDRLQLEQGGCATGAPCSRTPLMWAAALRSTEAVQLLLAHEPQAAVVDLRDSNRCTALHLAIQAGAQLELLQALLDAGARPDAADGSGATALALAAEREDREATARLLLRQGASADLPDFALTTPLMRAAAAGSTGTVRALLDAGAQQGLLDASGASALAYATRSGRREAAEVLSRAAASESKAQCKP